MIKALAWMAVLASTPVFGTLAPDSIAGKVYRSKTVIASLRGGSEATILFHGDGRYTYLKSASVNFVSEDFAGDMVLLRAPVDDGVYSYTKMDDTNATVAFTPDDGSEVNPLALHFTSTTGGGTGSDSVFTFSDLSAIQTAPALNVSLRGNVSSGHPLIGGFVVPGIAEPEDDGIPAIQRADATARDVLIRVAGPSLTEHGVSNVWADPDFRLHHGSDIVGSGYHYADWSNLDHWSGGAYIEQENSAGVAGFKKVFDHVGAFPLLEGSTEAAQVTRLAPGTYTVVAAVSGDDPGGEALIEVYFLP